MRVITGSRKGRRLNTFEGRDIRPMTDRVKESVFSIIEEVIPGAVVLDLFSGTGSLGIEALSRGASHVTYVEKSPKAIGLLRKNLKITQFEEASEIVKMNAFDFIRRASKHKKQYELVFADPPYAKVYEALLLSAVSKGNLVMPGGLLVIGHQAANKQVLEDSQLFLIRKKTYGNTLVSIFGKELE